MGQGSTAKVEVSPGPSPADLDSETKETTKRTASHMAFAKLLQPMVLFTITGKGLSKKEGGTMLAMWL